MAACEEEREGGREANANVHINSFTSSSLSLYAACITRHRRGQKKKTDIKGAKHAQVKAMQQRGKSSSMRKRGEGGMEMEWKGGKEREKKERRTYRDTEGERIPSQIGLEQFVVTKRKKKKKASVSWRGNRKRCLAGTSTLLAIVHTLTHKRTHTDTHPTQRMRT